MSPLERITERVSRMGDVNDPAVPRPLLTLGEFFEGNQVVGSIGCNLTPTPQPADFHELLRRIAARPEVADIRVEITMFDDPDWPFSETVWVMTTARLEQVAEWFPVEWRPDDCWTGWTDGTNYEPYTVPVGSVPVACWWD